jgi:dTMP kinase
MTARGLFVTFEGGEGSGKSTQLERLAARLRASGVGPLVTREPGGTPLAEGVRALLLDPEGSPDAMAEALLMEAARADLVATVLRPALHAGRIVLCDRYDDSTLAYQGAGRGLDAEMLRTLNRFATGGLRPDLTLLYDIDPAVGIARRAESGKALDRLDRESLAFHLRVRERFLDLARAEPKRFVVLDASGSAAELEARAWSALEPRLAAAGLSES